MLSNVKFVQEKRLISKFFDEISQDTGKFVFSGRVQDTCTSMLLLITASSVCGKIRVHVLQSWHATS